MANAMEEKLAELEDAKLKADPSIAVADLESAFNKFMKDVGCRNLQQVVSLIKDNGCTWKTSPKAENHKDFIKFCKRQPLSLEKVLGLKDS